MQDDRIKEYAVKFKACVWLNSVSPLCECHIYSSTHLFFFYTFCTHEAYSGTGNNPSMFAAVFMLLSLLL